MKWIYQKCPYCDPYETNLLHLEERIENIFLTFLSPILYLSNNIQTILGINQSYSNIFLRMLLVTRILKRTSISESEKEISNRTLLIIKELNERDIRVSSLKFRNKHTNFYSFNFQGIEILFETIPTTALKGKEFKYDNKYIFKKHLEENGFKTISGKVFRNINMGVQYGIKLGFPLVVKPRDGSLSKHTTCEIADENSLKKAIKIAKIMQPHFIVEKFILGSDYRAVIVGGKLVACCHREKPNVIGDEKHTLEELIVMKNADLRRGEREQKNTTLHKIIITNQTKNLLSEQSVKLNSTIPLNKKVFLSKKIILNCGADIHDVTDKICQKNINTLEQIAKSCHASLVGLDFICQDPSVDFTKQDFAILESNSLPYIDMHHFPVTGKPRNVAKAIIDLCLNTLSQR